MFPFDVRLRRFQQVIEALIFGSLFTVVIVMILKQSLRDDIVIRKGSCKEDPELNELAAKGMNSLAQRLLEFYFKLRYEFDFAFSIECFYSTMSLLALMSSMNAKSAIKDGIELPCDEQFLPWLVDWVNVAHLFEGQSKEFSSDFLNILNVTINDVRTSKAQFFEAMSTDDTLAKNLLTKHKITFRGTIAGLDTLIIGNKCSIGKNMEDPGNATSSVIKVEALKKNILNNCIVVYQLELNLLGLKLSLLTHKDLCLFSTVIDDLGYHTLNQVLDMKMNEDYHEDITQVIVQMPTILLRNNHALAPPIQLFDIINIFDRDTASFVNVFKNSLYDQDLALKNVDQSNLLWLPKDIFYTLNVEQFTDDLCGSPALFFIHHDDPVRVVAVGKINSFICS